MSQKEIQRVVVLITFDEADKGLIMNGIRIAMIFRKELCLVYNTKKKQNDKIKILKQELDDYISFIHIENDSINVSGIFIRRSISELPEILADEHEAIIILADSGKFKKYSGAVLHSPVPFLFIKHGALLSSFNRIVFPVDMRRGNSDTALWCSYFGRFNRSELFIIAANHKGQHEKKQVARNIAIIKKLMKKFNIPHNIYKGRKSSFRIAFEATEFGLASGCDMLVLTGSSVITPLDRLIGIPEKKIIRHSGSLPVLLVNPRRENYFLCD